MIVKGINNYANDLENKQRMAKKESEEKTKIARKKWKDCRESWEGKDKVPIRGGGWVDIKKIPYDFILMQEDDTDGLCKAVGIMERWFYWDGEKIIPEHDAFSGNQHGTFGSLFATHIPMYPVESWGHFSIKATFRNQREVAECEKKEGGYSSTFWGCLKTCGPEDWEHVIYIDGRCIRHPEKMQSNNTGHQVIQLFNYPDVEFIIEKNYPPYNRNRKLRFRLKNWNHLEKAPILHILLKSGKNDFNKLSIMEIQEIENIENYTFGFGGNETTEELFYFKGGKAMPRGSKIPFSDIGIFSEKIYQYLSSIVISEEIL